MKIARRSSSKNLGYRNISLEKCHFSYNKTATILSIEGHSDKDFTGTTTHNYSITLDHDEIIKIINTLAAAAIANPNAFEETFSSTLKAFTQLSLVTSGIVKGS
jgi:ribosomal protein L25 (general stress protein Ctc)